MERLAKRISEQLKTDRQHAVSEEDLTRVWPLSDPRREAKIAQFATERGWRLRFYKEGSCAIFENKLPKRRQSVSGSPIKSIQLRPSRGGWKVFDVPSVEAHYIGKRAKEDALYFAKALQQANNQPILIFDSDGILTETIAPPSSCKS